MTIRIKVTNEDSRENAIVAVKTLNNRPKSLIPIVNETLNELKGGESSEVYVYDGQSVLVEEIKNG